MTASASGDAIDQCVASTTWLSTVPATNASHPVAPTAPEVSSSPAVKYSRSPANWAGS